MTIPTDDDPDAILGAQRVSKGARRGGCPPPDDDAPFHGLLVALLATLLLALTGVTTYLLFTT